ncbi:hypothetical protein, partial [Burkholderia multivorans]|uniref:hypothetical protein n=1 Tax=Burkholderia multivorans TaxID=87883 RepID=UPI001C24DFC8
KNSRLRVRLVLRSNPVVPRLICFMSILSHIRRSSPGFCRPSLAPAARSPPGAIFTRLFEGSTVKLTFAISVVALVLIAGTTTICLSGAVTDRTTEYGSVRATFDQLFSVHRTVCR